MKYFKNRFQNYFLKTIFQNVSKQILNFAMALLNGEHSLISSS